MKSRNSVLYLSGRLISTFGDRILFLAVGIWVRVLTGSNADAGLTFFFYLAPSVIVGPVAGLIADRFPRRWVLMAADLAAAVSVLALFLVNGAHQLWLIYAAMALYGSFATVGSAAGVGLMTTVYAENEYGKVNALISTVSEGMRLFVPLIGAGLFVLVGAKPIFVIDIASYAVAIGALAWIRVVEEHEPSLGEHWTHAITEGMRYIHDSRVLFRLTLAFVVLLATVGFFETAMFGVVTDGLGRSAAFVGVLVSAQGIGAIVGGTTSAALMKRLGEARVIMVGIVSLAVGTIVPAVASFPHSLMSTAAVCISAVVLGLGITWLLVAANTAIQKSTPKRLMGRVDGALNTMFSGVQSISVAVGAGLVGLVGFRIPLWLIVLGALASALIFRGVTVGPSVSEAETG